MKQITQATLDHQTIKPPMHRAWMNNSELNHKACVQHCITLQKKEKKASERSSQVMALAVVPVYTFTLPLFARACTPKSGYSQ
jgi:hypothetical protein